MEADSRAGSRFTALIRRNPVVIRELRSRMRGGRAFVVLTVYLLLLGGSVSLSFIPLASMSFGFGYDLAIRQVIGKSMFGIAVFIQFIVIAFVAPGITAGAIASEREHQTYDILRSSLLTARQLVTGKLLAALSFLFLLLLVAFPVQSLAFLLGGVTLEEVFVAALMLLTTAVAFGTIGIFLSSWFKRTLVATVLAYAVSVFAIAGLPFLILILASLAGPMASYFFGYGGGGELNPITAAGLIGLAWMLVSINPISAALASETILLQEQSAWYISIPLSGTSQYPNPPDIPLLSPWIGYVVGYLLISLVLIWLSIRIVRRPER